MLTSSLILAAISLFPAAFGAPIARNQRRATAADYHVYGGDGTTSQGWPSESSWLSFEDLWDINKDTITSSCSQFPGKNGDVPADTTPAERDVIKSAIESVSKESGVDARYLLSIMMQESKGCVRAPTTNYGHDNPGLFQTFDGKASCNRDGITFETPCPDSTIELMVKEGAGLTLEFGLGQALKQSLATDVSQYYKGARIYNSGSVAAGGNLGAGIATHCYSTDVANRLTGWGADKPSGCEEGTIGSVQGSTGGSPVTEEPIDTPTPTDAPIPTSTPTSTPDSGSGDVGSEIPTDSEASTGIKIDGAASDCKTWYTVKSGDSCSSLPAPFATLQTLNPVLDSSCSNLWVGYAYCVAN